MLDPDALALAATAAASSGLWLEMHRRRGKRLHPQVAPGRALADQGRQAEGDSGRDLDRLQDDAVGESVSGPDPEAGMEDADDRELKDADVGRGRRQTAVTLTANRTAAAARIPAWWLRPSAAKSAQQAESWIAQAVSWAAAAASPRRGCGRR